MNRTWTKTASAAIKCESSGSQLDKHGQLDSCCRWTYRVEHPLIMAHNASVRNFLRIGGTDKYRQVARRGLVQAKVKVGSYLRVVNTTSRVLLDHLGKSSIAKALMSGE